MAEVAAVEAVAVKAPKAKRLKRGNIHTYKTAKGTKYMCQVRIKGHYDAQTFDNMKDAKAWRATKVAEFTNGEAASKVPSKMTMATLFDTYINESEKAKNPLSPAMVMMVNRLKAHPAFSDTKVSKVDYTMVRGYCIERKASGICPSTIQSEFVRINLALKSVGDWLNWGKKFNPLDGVRTKLRKEKLISDSIKRHRRPEPWEMDALLAYFREFEARERAEGVPEHLIIPMCDLVQFAALNAFRLGEIVALEWADLDTDSIVCWRKDCTAPFIDEAHKGKRRDVTPVLNQAREIILRQRRAEGEARIFPFIGDTISGRFTDACKKLGITDLRFHDLRHEAISTIAQHVGLPEAMKVSGHITTRAFLRYVNFGNRDATRIVDKLNSIKLTSAATV